MNTPDIKQFIKYLKSDSEDTRVRAVIALAASGHEHAAKVLKTVANVDTSARVRFEAKRLRDDLFKQRESSEFNAIIASVPEDVQDLKVSTFMNASAFRPLPEAEPPLESATELTVDTPIVKSGGVQSNRSFIMPEAELNEFFLQSSPVEQIKLIRDIEKSIMSYKLFLNNTCAKFNEKSSPQLDEDVRATIVKSYGAIGGPDDIAAIAKCLGDSNIRVKANAIEGLELIGHPKAFPYIAHFLRDKDNRIRANVVKALQKFGKRNLEGMLDDMLLSEKKWMRSSAAYCLAIMATEDQIPLLRRGLEDPERSVRSKIRAAIERLSKEGSEDATALLAECPEQTLVFHACDNSSLDILADGTVNIGQLFHEEARFRASEVLRIAKLNDPKYISVLYDCLEQESTEIVAKEIFSVICKFKPVNAVNQIAGKLNDSNPKIVELAVSAIMEIDSEAGVPLVAGLLNHSDLDVATNTFVELKKASTELAIGQVELLLHSLRAGQRKKGLSFLKLVESNEAPEYFDKTILSLFSVEKEVKLVDEIATLYGHFVTRETLEDYFHLKTKYSRKKLAAQSGKGSISALSEAKLESLGRIRTEIAEKLNLSPEDLGTMEGEAAKSIEETAEKQKAHKETEKESQIIKVAEEQAKSRRSTIFATAMPILLIALISGGLWFSKPYWKDWFGPETSSSTVKAKPKPKAKPSLLGAVGAEVDVRCVVKKIRPLSNSLICIIKRKGIILSAWFAEKDLSGFKSGDEIRLKGIIEGTGNNSRAIMLKGTLARNL